MPILYQESVALRLILYTHRMQYILHFRISQRENIISVLQSGVGIFGSIEHTGIGGSILEKKFVPECIAQA